MDSLSSQIKAKFQYLSSPKIKLNTSNNAGSAQSPTNTTFQKPPTVKFSQRDGNNQSQSPDDNNTTRDVLQRIQMKNLAFIPAKNQSIISQNVQLQACNFTNLNNSGFNDQGQSQITKISPSRIMGTSGNKMIIPANQIKLIKKDGLSPSPEARQVNIKQLSPNSVTFVNQASNQNINPNITANQNRNSQRQFTKNAIAIKPVQVAEISDDETNVNSDNEERVSTLSQMKTDSSNFNRPKINTNQQSKQNLAEEAFTDNTLTQQRTQRGSQAQNTIGNDPQRIKIISHNKIRQSPSPPPNQVLKNNDKPPTVTNVQNQMKGQIPQFQQQPSQSQLASDYIKGMINQSRSNNTLSQNTSQKWILGAGIQNCLKNSITNQQANFQKDMKKHGLSKDIQEVSKFGKVMSENSPPRQEDTQNQNAIQQKAQIQKISISKISHIRNYSPPPNFDQVGLTNIHEVKEAAKTTIKPTDNSPTNTSTQNEDQQQVSQGEPGSVFQFPFQRRARSLSLPKQDMIQNKMNQKNVAVQPGQTDDKTSQSPSRPQESQERRNKPVMAKINFVIAQKGLMQKEDHENIFERNKEVDEWLMGSGESDATAGSSKSNNKLLQVPGIMVTVRSTNNIQVKKQELEKPIQPVCQIECHEDSIGEEEEEDWMFRTFDKVKAGKPKTHKVAKTNRTNNERKIESNRDFNLDNDLGDSPFDMAPEMQKQFSKPIFKNMQDQFLPEHNGTDCQDLSQFIDKIDQFMERIQ